MVGTSADCEKTNSFSFSVLNLVSRQSASLGLLAMVIDSAASIPYPRTGSLKDLWCGILSPVGCVAVWSRLLSDHLEIIDPHRRRGPMP